MVKHLRLGPNRLVAKAPRARGARLKITNHPNGGPVFSGPQVQPWFCQESAVDEQCNQPPEYTYLYRSTDPTKPELLPYDPANPPGDVATTTTDEGLEVPFIVRQELGYQDRDRYKFLTLYTPGEPMDPLGATAAVEQQAARHRRRRVRRGLPARKPTAQRPERHAAEHAGLHAQLHRRARARGSRSCRPRSPTPATTATSPPRRSR